MQEQLILYSDLRSEVMSRAGELRSEGLGASEALSLAWDEVRNPRVKRAVKKAVESEGVSGLFLLAVAYAIWVLVKKSWTPWQPRLIAQTRPIARPEIAVSKNNPGHSLNPGRDYGREVVNILDPSEKRGL